MTVTPLILLNKQYAEPMVFTAENLLREARRQKSLTRVHVPRICMLDPDGDDVFLHAPVAVYRGATWTTDAPFRETETAIAHCRDLGIMAVEMEAAALYAFAEARQKAVVCFAHVTNQMATAEDDFEKGADGGSQDALQVVALATHAYRSHRAT